MMRIIEVEGAAGNQQFLHFPIHLYKNDPHWIRPLDKDVEEVFDPAKNRLFKSGGKVKRWLAVDDQGNTAGRIAAFVNPKTANKFKQKTGGVGFFESVEDKDVAFALFDTAKQWLQHQGMEAMDGPINFGERDKWWGLLVHGFDIDPNYNCNYHKPYYQMFFEDYGFQLYFKQFTFGRPVQGGLPDSYAEKAARIARVQEYSFRHIEPKKLEKYVEDFLTIYNKAWTKHEGVAALRKPQAMVMFKKMKPVMDKDIVWYAYYKNEPVGFFVMLPELNQIFKHINGKLDLVGKLKFLYHKMRGTCRKCFGVVFGIVPEHQGKGLEGAMVMAVAKHIWPLNKYDDFEMNWIGDFNPKMIKISESIGADVKKVHHTYRYLFDRNAPFERAPILH